MILEDNEFTIPGLLEFLIKKFGTKKTNKSFNKSDIAQYMRRKQLPIEYGGNVLEIYTIQGIKIIKLK